MTGCFLAWKGADLDFICCIAVNITGEKGSVKFLHDFELFQSNFAGERNPALSTSAELLSSADPTACACYFPLLGNTRALSPLETDYFYLPQLFSI